MSTENLDSGRETMAPITDRDDSELHAASIEPEQAELDILREAKEAEEDAAKAKADEESGADADDDGEDGAGAGDAVAKGEGDGGADAVQPPPAVKFQPPQAQSEARDFDAERNALWKQYDDGELTQAEYDRKRDAITKAETMAEFAAAQSQQSAANAMAEAANRFVQANPAWQNVLVDAEAREKFQKLLNHVDTEHAQFGQNLSDDDLLVKTAQRFVDMGLAQAPAPVKPGTQVQKPATPAPARRPDLTSVPGTMSQIPAAGAGDDKATRLLNLPTHEDLEDALATMSDDEFDRLARSVA